MTKETGIMFIIAVLQAIVVWIAVSKIGKYSKKLDERADARKEDNLLSLELNMATAKLSYAVALALKRGVANGEIEEGVDAFEAAKDRYQRFLNNQALDHLIK